jgi:hypothetical protein
MAQLRHQTIICLLLITSNRYEILQEESKNESYVINDDQVIHTEDVDLQTKRYNHGKTIRTDKAKSKPKENANANTEKSVKTTYIVGDSMIKHLDCHRLNRSVQNGNKRVHAETYIEEPQQMQCNTILSHVSKENLTKSFYTLGQTISKR